MFSPKQDAAAYPEQISLYVQQGRIRPMLECIQKALQEGVSAEEILEDGLLGGMNQVSARYKRSEIYIPEVLVASRAMSIGMEALESAFSKEEKRCPGTVILGTVKGDLHDIGKELVKMMMESKGLNVIDVGVDVPAQTFVDKAIKHDAKVIACSALLTTTMPEIEKVVKAVEKAGLSEKIRVMAGGAPVSRSFCDHIHAVYTPDAIKAAEAALAYCISS